MKTLKCHEFGPDISLTDYPDQLVQVFDLNSTQEVNIQMHYPDIMAACLRFELYFEKQLDNTVEVIILGERLSAVHIDKTGKVSKHG